jgi:hypothetical protein
VLPAGNLELLELETLELLPVEKLELDVFPESQFPLLLEAS